MVLIETKSSKVIDHTKPDPKLIEVGNLAVKLAERRNWVFDELQDEEKEHLLRVAAEQITGVVDVKHLI